MNAQPEPSDSGISFLPVAPLTCVKRMPALSVMSVNVTAGGVNLRSVGTTGGTLGVQPLQPGSSAARAQRLATRTRQPSQPWRQNADRLTPTGQPWPESRFQASFFP